MRRRSTFLLVAITVTAAIVAAVVLIAHGSPSVGDERAATHAAGQGGPVTIDSTAGEVFVPSRTSAPQMTLTAAEAYEQYAGHPLPTGTMALYGKLTLPTSNPSLPTDEMKYRYKNTPAWGYRSQGGCARGYGFSSIPTPASGVCTQWLFLDPTTGQELDATHQG